MWCWAKFIELSLPKGFCDKSCLALFYITQIRGWGGCDLWLTLVSFLSSYICDLDFGTQSQSWLQWAAGGCFSQTATPCLALKRCLCPGTRQVSQTWAWAFSLSVCLAGTNPGAARRRTRTRPCPMFKPAHPLVSARPLTVCIVGFSVVGGIPFPQQSFLWLIYRYCKIDCVALVNIEMMNSSLCVGTVYSVTTEDDVAVLLCCSPARTKTASEDLFSPNNHIARVELNI